MNECTNEQINRSIDQSNDQPMTIV